jgi:hypothetical protein
LPQETQAASRDVLIGARQAPSAIGAISESRSLSIIIRLWNPVLLFDAAGLAFFAVSGAQRRSTMAGPRGDIAWDVRRIGGGMIQNVLLTEIPTVCFASATGADLVQELRQGCQDRCRPQPENGGECHSTPKETRNKPFELLS